MKINLLFLQQGIYDSFESIVLCASESIDKLNDLKNDIESYFPIFKDIKKDNPFDKELDELYLTYNYNNKDHEIRWDTLINQKDEWINKTAEEKIPENILKHVWIIDDDTFDLVIKEVEII